MKRMTYLLAGALYLGATSGWAMTLGTEITIYDKWGTGSGWNGGPHEDQEVEPPDQEGQEWDLEGFFLNGSTLSMVGGYDFEHGEYGSHMLLESGDIFLDVTGDVVFGQDIGDVQDGNGTHSITNSFGYDYVLDLDFSSFTYDIYDITDETLVSVYYNANERSNPWRYEGGGNRIGSGTIGYTAGLSDSDANGFLGGAHNVVTVDVGFLPHATTFTSHFTIECGNDNLMGRGTVVPEPGTMLLLGTGLIGLSILGRKRWPPKD